MTSLIGLTGLLVLLGQATPPAPPPQTSTTVDASALAKKIAADDRLVVLDADGHRLDGRFGGLTGSGLTIVDPSGRQNTIALPKISKIVREDSKRKGTLVGLGVGLAAGITYGALINMICENETGGCGEAIFILGALGAAGGAGIGLAVDGMRKEMIYGGPAPTPDAAAALGLFRPEVGVNVGGGHFSGFGMGLPAPVSLGGSWGFHQKHGLGVQLDISRTLGQSRQTIDCVPDASGRCVGSGEEGVNKILSGTAQARYFFPTLGHVQPYIGAGFGVHNTVVLQSFAAVPFLQPVRVNTAIASTTQAAMVVSGGVRIDVTKSLALDPAIMFMDARDLTNVRASVGIAYAW